MENYINKQLTEGYNGKLNDLFEEWMASYPADVAKNKFCPDGLVAKYLDGYDVNIKWEESQRKIMFLLKDCPDEWRYDTRRLLVGYEDKEDSLINAQNTRNLKSPRKDGRGDTGFIKNIATIFHGLYYMTEENKGIELTNDAKDHDKSCKTFNEVPFAFIECKKIAGTTYCPTNSLNVAMEEDKDFLAKEIDILKPNMIVCCDKEGNIFNNIVKYYFNGAVPDEDSRWDYEYSLENGTKCGFRCKLYYYKEKGILLFDSYHPTSLGKDGWKIYENVFSPFRQFFARYKTFDVISAANKTIQ